MGVIYHMSENLTHGTKQRATNDGVSTQIFCYVKSAPIMFAWKGLMFSVVLEDVSSWCSGGLSR